MVHTMVSYAIYDIFMHAQSIAGLRWFMIASRGRIIIITMSRREPCRTSLRLHGYKLTIKSVLCFCLTTPGTRACCACPTPTWTTRSCLCSATRYSRNHGTSWPPSSRGLWCCLASQAAGRAHTTLWVAGATINTTARHRICVVVSVSK